MKAILFLFLSTVCALAQLGSLDQATLGLSLRVLGSAASTGNDATESTGSYTPRQETELIAIVINSKAATPDQPVVVANGLTWTEVFDTNYLSTHRLTVWYARCASGGIQGVFNANTGATAQTGWAIAVVEITGAVITGINGVNSIRQSVNANQAVATNVVATFAALGKRTICLGLLGANLNSANMAAEPGWTKQVDVNYNTPATELTIVSQAKNADTTCLVTNAAPFSACIVGIEMVQVGAFPIMQRDPKTIPDGFLTLIGGQDSGKSPSIIRDDQASELWNVTVRGGYPTNRPGFKKITLTYATNEIQEWFTTEVHQGAIVFKPYGQQPAIQVWSVGGRLFTIDVLTGGMVQEVTPTLSTQTSANFTVPGVGASVAINVTDATMIYPDYPILINGQEYQVTAISGSTLTATNIDDTPAAIVTAGAVVSYLDPNARFGTKVWMQQADRFLIVQDGFSRAIIFDGAIVRRADPSRLEIPTGTVMAYGLGRLWVAINEREFVAGDIIYGPTGTSFYNFADAILKFTENTFLAEGGAFSLPFEAGKITAMDFMPVWDTSTGQGPLMIFTDSSATSVNASPNRDTWKNVQSPIQAVSMRGPGPKGSWSTVPIVNGDIFFRSPDGIRSLALAVRAWGDWGSTPMSTEMDNVLIDDDERWLFWTSAIVFDNRLLMTSGNRPGGLRPKFNGIVALDFHVISSMGEKSPPVYDGTWTGISIWQLYKGNYDGLERAFAAVQSVDGLNELWEISKASRFDGAEGRIVSTLITRNIFNRQAVNFGRLENCEIWIDDIVGTVDLTLSYRPDQYPCFLPWGTAQVCVEFKDCTSHDNCEALAPQFRPGYRTRIGFGQPPDGDEFNDAKPQRIGYEFQVKLQWEGKARVRKMRVKRVDVDEQPSPDVGITNYGQCL